MNNIIDLFIEALLIEIILISGAITVSTIIYAGFMTALLRLEDILMRKL